jgi:hypothetical protein
MLFQPKINRSPSQSKSLMNLDKLTREWTKVDINTEDNTTKPDKKFNFELPNKLIRKEDITDQSKPIFYLKYSGESNPEIDFLKMKYESKHFIN